MMALRFGATVRTLLIGTLLALILATILATPAHAGWRINRSLEIAQIVWRPACGQLRVFFEDPGADDIDVAGWAWAGDCTIRLNRIGDWPETWHSFPQLCDTILHEAGHVAGVGHSSNPASIMYPEPRALARVTSTTHGGTIGQRSDTDSRCQHRGRAFLERHGLLTSAAPPALGASTLPGSASRP